MVAAASLSLYLFAANKLQYDFTRRVLSVSLFVNLMIPIRMEKGSANRVIGRVLPYSKYQIKYNGKPIVSTEIAAAGSTLISGSTGSGKTYGILSLIRQNIANGNSVIFTEYKGDTSVINELKTYALRHGYDVYVLSGGKSNFNYDPLRNLNNSGRIEAILNMRKWSLDGSDAHYKTSTQLLLQKTIQEFTHKYALMVEKAEQKGDDNRLISYTYEYYMFMKSYQAGYGEVDSYVTVSKLLELLITSSLEPMFTFKNGKTLAFDTIKNKKFLLVGSFVSSNKELATSFSSLLFRDLLDEWTNVASSKNTFLYVDEFGSVENPFIIKDILEKGRSAHLAPTLSLQDINQIVIQTNEAYLNSILGTINTFIVYSGATRVTAEKFAGVQLADIEAVLMNLRKPIDGHRPTAIYISKYPTLNKRITSEVFRFEPYIFDKNARLGSKMVKFDQQQEQVKVEELGKNVERNRDFDDLMAGRLTESEKITVEEQTIALQRSKLEEEKVHQSLDVEPETVKRAASIKLRLNVQEDDGVNNDLNSLIFGDKK
jgi:hypothetical protein